MFIAVGFVSATLIAPTVSPAEGGFDVEVAAEQLNRLVAPPPDSATVGTPAETATETALVIEPPRFAVFGDSVSLSIAFPVATWARESGEAVYVGSDAVPGCGIGRGGQQNAFGVAEREQVCETWPERWTAFIDQYKPNIAIIQTAQWELIPRQIARRHCVAHDWRPRLRRVPATGVPCCDRHAAPWWRCHGCLADRRVLQRDRR